MLPWPYAINSIEMNHGYIATSLKIVLLKGIWMKTKDRKHHLFKFEKWVFSFGKPHYSLGKYSFLKQRL